MKADSPDSNGRGFLAVNALDGNKVFCYVPGSGACLIEKDTKFDFEGFCRQIAESQDPGTVFASKDEHHEMLAIVTEAGGIKFNA